MQKDGVNLHKRKSLKALNQGYLERLKWYKTQQWYRLRRLFLKDSPFCCDCGEKADTVDHINGHDPLTWREHFYEGPFQSMCHPCHSRKTALFDMKNKPTRLTLAEKKKLLET